MNKPSEGWIRYCRYDNKFHYYTTEIHAQASIGKTDEREGCCAIWPIIEKSAYDQLQAKLAVAREALEEIVQHYNEGKVNGGHMFAVAHAALAKIGD